jgi:hypothetical protein
VSYWWCEWAVVGRRHLLSGCLRDCSSEVGRVWRATLGWRFCLSEFALIFGGIYWSNPIWIVIGVAAWLIALGLGFQDTGPLPPNDALSRLSELVQLALSFLLLSGLMAAGSIYLTTMKLPEWNITYSQQQFGLAEMLVGTPMAVLLLLLLIILGTASFLARNGQALLPREKRWKCARRISPAAITLIGACYLTVGFYNLMTTPELHDPHPGCSLNGLDYLALAPFGQVLKDKSCHSE